MRLDVNMRNTLGVVLAAGLLTLMGCTHNYYYTPPGAIGPCAPVTVLPGPTASTVQTYGYGDVCEVPTQVIGGGAVVAGPPLTTSPALTGARPPRVVLSDPMGRNRNRGVWHRPDPESSLATTRVEGALDDPTVTR